MVFGVFILMASCAHRVRGLTFKASFCKETDLTEIFTQRNCRFVDFEIT